MTIRAGLLLDGRGAELRDALITVRGDRIQSVAAYRGGPVTYDLSRYTVLPGLIDAHVHIISYFNRLGRASSGNDGDTPEQRRAGRAANALATLRAGFTTVASMGSDADRELRDAIAAGRLPGPRILTSLDPLINPALTPKEIRAALRERAWRGADFIKIFGSGPVRSGGRPTLSPAQLAALCGGARSLGLRPVVHVQSDSSIRLALDAGCGQLEHGVLATAEGLRLIAERQAYLDPQCGLLLDNYLENRAHYEGLPGFRAEGFGYLAELRPRLPQLLRSALATPGLMLLYGTDASAGAHGRNAEDLICRVREAGQPPMEALVTATSRNAAGLGLGDRVGTVAAGYQADLIALDGNPLERIEAVRLVRFVMKAGRVFVAP